MMGNHTGRGRSDADAAWLRARLERLGGYSGKRLAPVREARQRYTATNQVAERYLAGEINVLNSNLCGLVEQIVESSYVVQDRGEMADYLARQAVTVAGWPVIAIHYRAMAEQAPAVCDFVDDLDLMRRLALDFGERCADLFGTERDEGDFRGPGVWCLKEDGELIPRPEPDLDEATFLRARAARLLRQRQEAASENEAELRSLAAEDGSAELIAELRSAQEQWVTPANTLLTERAIDVPDGALWKARLDEADSTAPRWPAVAGRYSSLARRFPGLCVAFDRADLLRRLLIEILHLPGR